MNANLLIENAGTPHPIVPRFVAGDSYDVELDENMRVVGFTKPASERNGPPTHVVDAVDLESGTVVIHVLEK